mmetsp:Transcript_64036/g.180277  ORF Transcript_64036/g.180277 Transcript_64036/m.180277 type:complete len:283 (+) Transcript_64036:31-879(+)
MRAPIATQEVHGAAEVLAREPGADPHGQAGGRRPLVERVDHPRGGAAVPRHPAPQVLLGRGGGVHPGPVAPPAVHRAHVEVVQHEHAVPRPRAGAPAAPLADEVADRAEARPGAAVLDERCPGMEPELLAQKRGQGPLEPPHPPLVLWVPPARAQDHRAIVAGRVDELREAADHSLAAVEGGGGHVLRVRGVPVPYFMVVSGNDLLGQVVPRLTGTRVLLHLESLAHIRGAQLNHRARVLDAHVEHSVNIHKQQRANGLCAGLAGAASAVLDGRRAVPAVAV